MKLFKNLWFYVIIVFLLWGLSWCLLIYAPGGDHGKFGDMFGAVNALFSGLAFVGVIYALFQQMEGLKMQKEELELQRNELKETREEFKIQNETLKRQRFENTFFHLLNLHNELVDNIYVAIGPSRYEKKEVFKNLKLKLSSQFKEEFEKVYHKQNNIHRNFPVPEYQNFSQEENKQIIAAVLKVFFGEYLALTKPYFANVLHIISYIHSSHLFSSQLTDGEDKFYYDLLLKNLMTDWEHHLFFYYCVHQNLGGSGSALNIWFGDFNWYKNISVNIPKEHILIFKQ